MSTLTFDTYKYAERLKQGGFSETQAQAGMEALQIALDESFDVRELATKQDINALRHDIKTLELSTQVNIETIKSELIKWFAGLLIAQGAIIAALVKLL
jgi:hypothetical protein